MLYIILGIVFIAIGLLILLSPSTFYRITQSWKNASDAEPSRLFTIHARFGGVMFSLVGIASLVLPFL